LGRFREKWRFGVVFLWTSCGELAGKDGLLNVVFRDAFFLQEICGNRKNSSMVPLRVQLDAGYRSE
jgi:hypothetical protein